MLRAFVTVVVTACLLLPSGTVRADEASRTDEKGDARAVVDLIRVHYDYGRKKLRAVARLDDLDRKRSITFQLRVGHVYKPSEMFVEPEQYVDVWFDRKRRTRTQYWYWRELSDKDRCQGLSVDVVQPKDKVVFEVPRRCLARNLRGRAWLSVSAFQWDRAFKLKDYHLDYWDDSRRRVDADRVKRTKVRADRG